MPVPVINQQKLLAAIQAGSYVLTANSHLAVHLKAIYNQAQQKAGLAVWRGAQVQTWSSWINSLFTGLLDRGQLAGLLLNEQQERLLWEQAIRHFDNSGGLLNVGSAAQTAISAHQLLADWKVSLNDVTRFANDETRLFLKWHHYVHKILDDHGWIPTAHLTQLVIDNISAINLADSQVVLAGYHEFTPIQQNLLDVLQASGCEISQYQPPRHESDARLLATTDPEAETRLVIGWALDHLEKTPAARIGIVVPDLDTRRPQLERLLTESCHPGTLLPGAADSSRQFSILMPGKLADYPAIHDAMLILKLCLGRHSYSETGALLRSPFIAGGLTEQTERGTLDRELRALGMPEFSLNLVLKHLSRNHGTRQPQCPILQVSLGKLSAILDALPGEDRPGNWVDHFFNLLNAIGWPGERSLNSAEYQQIDRFRSVLSILAKLDPIRKNLSFTQAFSYLRRSTENTWFQAQSPETPIQVMGVLEASGMHFDHCWLLGFDDNAWPATAHPNPLLPINLQRDYDLPNASPNRTLSYAQKITRQLLKCAPEIVASYPHQNGDRQCRPSPLVAHLPPETVTGSSPTLLWSIPENSLLQRIEEQSVPATGEDLTGGTALIADQSACPFRAFANHRLRAKTLEEPGYPLDPRIAGSLVHDVMELIWERLQDHKTLVSMPPEKLSNLVQEVVTICLPAARKKRPDLFNDKFMRLEAERLHGLILDWLEQEKTRQPFRAIKLELETRYLAGPLTINMRADRIDELEDGQHVIIDYKTGSNINVNSWLDTRLGEPQVPLYCITGEFTPAAAAIAKINVSKCEFKGLAATANIADGLREYTGWPELLDHWKQSIDRLAAEYCRGHASVDPGKGACDYCALDTLCRIGEHQNG